MAFVGCNSALFCVDITIFFVDEMNENRQKNRKKVIFR